MERRGSHEARKITGHKAAYKPSKAELAAHHRKWCPHCVRGKCKGAIHKKRQKSEKESGQEMPSILLDYMGKNTKDEKSRKIVSSPVVAGW